LATRVFHTPTMWAQTRCSDGTTRVASTITDARERRLQRVARKRATLPTPTSVAVQQVARSLPRVNSRQLSTLVQRSCLKPWAARVSPLQKPVHTTLPTLAVTRGELREAIFDALLECSLLPQRINPSSQPVPETSRTPTNVRSPTRARRARDASLQANPSLKKRIYKSGKKRVQAFMPTKTYILLHAPLLVTVM